MSKIATVLRAALIFFLSLSFGAVTHAQDYPSKSVRIIAPYAAGGGTDILARLVARHLSDALKQPFVVENIPGANGTIGTATAANAPADGYTLVLGSPGPNAINAALYGNLPYDMETAFVPISMIAMVPNILVVHESVPAKNVAELISLVRQNPGVFSYGSSGIGGLSHLSGELFSSKNNIKMIHVPYKGAAAAYPDLLSGTLKVMFPDILSALPHIKSGKIRPLGLTTTKRSSIAPDIPTLSEAGMKDFNVVLWYGLFAPAKTPRHVIEKLNAETVKILKDPALRAQLAAQGAEAMPTSTEEADRFVKSEVGSWTEFIKKSGLRADKQ